ncbi:unnamed protein product, partial [Brassica rapa]
STRGGRRFKLLSWWWLSSCSQLMVACSALRRRRDRASTSRSFDATKLLRRFSSSASPPRDLWSKSSPP